MDADDLYGLPLDRFVAERGQLAKRLRAEGRRAEADAVAALRKPSVAAWAVNQLWRTQRAAVDELLGAGDGLRDAQAALLGGRGGGHDLRGAMQRERAAAEALLGPARGLLSSEGHELSPTVLERVSDTLHAAALSDDAREAIGDGRLERELRHVGLGVDGVTAPVSRPTSKPRSGSKSKPSPRSGAKSSPRSRAKSEPEQTPAQARQRARAERQEREQAERRRLEARKAARSAETSARRRSEHAARALRTAEERRDKAAAALTAAERTLAEARDEAEAAAAAHDRTQAELDAL